MTTLIGHESLVTCILALRDQFTIATSSDDCSVRFWNAYTGQVIKKLKSNFASVNAMTITKKDR